MIVAVKTQAVKIKELKLDIERIGPVSAILMQPDNARACCVLAHGAGTDMRHASMDKIAVGLAERGIATLRFNFPYTENKQGRPDQPAVAHATIRAAVEEAARLCPRLKLVAGGKSFGGRMTSQAQSKAALPGVRGLAFLGFPLHADKKPSTERAQHLAHVEIPMLFLQGTRDGLADLGLLRPVVAALGAKATLHEIEGGDHSFAVLKKSGRTNDEALAEVLDTLAGWIDKLG
ncbi:alpha/beta family hydrolase [Bradyrhizobium sp. GCM10023182]|uniref:Alpha/beta hydrolase n=1 Tax=Bradyrhizobium zhengyangense TaxID=2911009 RepID=A0ABS9LTT9_9BRAD|nr:alpha/beta family hydrolase [Bradyrhizobium zhengyangense]MCG2638848.1 alpha/beta hydrolase [Bradyrhizobium zhengyangense]MCG2670077.1 alpha/beta hydrolase [Bradyrhizobium zhengyangense]